MGQELQLVVDHHPPAKGLHEPLSFETQTAIALGITIIGIAIVGVGMLWWINSEGFIKASIDRLNRK